MERSVKPLAAFDLRHVPLPKGTEVTTRVEKANQERVVPMGALGRVLTSDGELVEVRIVGVGPIVYRREELLPRKVGQARHAIRRATDWEALAGCRILEATVGSRAWGLAGPGSDEDRRGIFALPFTWTTGLAEPPRDLISADGSSTYWELKKGVDQAVRADPNTLEMLFVDNVSALDPIGEWLLETKDAFVSVQIYGSFGRYALSQLKKLEQSLRLAEHRGIVLGWLREDPDLTLDAVARKLAKASIDAPASAADGLLRAKEYIKQLYRSLYDQGVIKERSLVALTAFAASSDHAFELPRELRPKNAYNLLRLIHTAIGWLKTGVPQLEVQGTLKARLLMIKNGEVPLAEVLAEAEAATPELEEARMATMLPEEPDRMRIDAFLHQAGAELARRHLERVPGPFGRDMPEPPAPRASEEVSDG